jgi:hypothetical protein
MKRKKGKKRVKKPVTFGFIATVGSSRRMFSNDDETAHERVCIHNIYRTDQMLFVRDHFWIPLKHVKDFEPGEEIKFKAKIKKYYHNGELKVMLVKIKDVRKRHEDL